MGGWTTSVEELIMVTPGDFDDFHNRGVDVSEVAVIAGPALQEAANVDENLFMVAALRTERTAKKNPQLDLLSLISEANEYTKGLGEAVKESPSWQLGVVIGAVRAHLAQERKK